MPCTDLGYQDYHPPTIQAVNDLANLKTYHDSFVAMVCAYLTKCEMNYQLIEWRENINDWSPELANWWEKHKAYDKERKAQELMLTEIANKLQMLDDTTLKAIGLQRIK